MLEAFTVALILNYVSSLCVIPNFWLPMAQQHGYLVNREEEGKKRESLDPSLNDNGQSARLGSKTNHIYQLLSVTQA